MSMINCPCQGIVMPLKKLGDGKYDTGEYGRGVCIDPYEQKYYAPFDGEVVSVSEGKETVTLKSDDGLEVLLKIGIKTEEMNGDGFQIFLGAGSKVKTGDMIGRFDVSTMTRLGYAKTVAVVVTNSDNYSDMKVLSKGMTTKSKPMVEMV